MASTSVLLVGHGTRSAAGTACFVRLHELLAERRPQWQVEHAFLELQRPTIGEAVARLADAEPETLVIAPLLLFSAGHAKTDVPAEVAAAVRDFPALGRARLVQAEALNCHASLVELLQRRYDDAVQSLSPVALEGSCLVLVGRGSRDAEATAEMHRLAALRAEGLPGVAVRVAFLAMAQPSVETVLEEVGRAGFERVVVQPHLLFPGELLDGLVSRVAALQQSQPTTEWLCTPPLAGDLGTGGPADQLLLAAVAERIEEALDGIC